MASGRDLEPDDASGELDRLRRDRGYTLGKDQRMEDILAVEAELLRSEGIDPAWPGFESDRKRRAPDRRGQNR